MFTRSRGPMPGRNDGSNRFSRIRPISNEIPPAPEELSAEPAVPPQILGDPSSPLVPMPNYVAPPPCDNCEPVFGGVVKENCCHDVSNWSPLLRFFGFGPDPDANLCSDIGIGH